MHRVNHFKINKIKFFTTNVPKNNLNISTLIKPCTTNTSSKRYYYQTRYTLNDTMQQQTHKSIQLNPAEQAQMIIGFTCNICTHRQFKKMSKKAYTTGLVIIKCDSCKKNHLIADHLGWFDSQKKVGTIQDIIKAKTGQDIDIKKSLNFDSEANHVMGTDELLEWLPDNEDKLK